jgi:hypothetical protein
MEKEQLTDFAIWMFNQRAMDIKFYGVNSIPNLVELYLEEKYGE